jgi:hypothetical protein
VRGRSELVNWDSVEDAFRLGMDDSKTDVVVAGVENDELEEGAMIPLLAIGDIVSE